MFVEALFGAAVKAMVDVFRNAGQEYLSDALKELVKDGDDQKRLSAFRKVHKAALAAVSDDHLSELLEQQEVQNRVLAGLLDANGLDIAQLRADYPDHARSLQQYVQLVKNGLLADTNCGPMLARFEDVQYHKEMIALMQERPQLQPGSLVRRLNAELHGAGAIAQEGAIAVGAGGKYQNIEQLIQVFVQNTAGPTVKDEGLRERYLREVARDANLLPWTKVNIEYARSESSVQFGLADIYTNLDTTEIRVREEAELRKFMRELSEKERVPAQEMLDRERLLLIMGDPGSGKSTFVKHLTYVLAQACLANQPEAWLKQIEPWQHGTLMPVRLELRRFAEFVDDKGQGSAVQILGYLRALLTEWQLQRFADELTAAIMDEEIPFLVMLDGLDEVPKAQRQAVVDATQDLATRYKKHRYVVTCRPYAYIGQPWKLKGFQEVTLAPFSQEQMVTFVDNWYGRLAASYLSAHEAEEKAAELKTALERHDLQELAERPLLLTVTTQLHTFKGKLPQDRTELYADAIDLLFERWEGRLGKDEGVLVRLNVPGLKRSDLESGLFEVAFKAHSRIKPEEQTADVERGSLVEWLTPYLSGDRNKAADFVAYIHERAGLLISHKTDEYTFPHRTFQEFMAACHLATRQDYAEKAAALVRDDFDRWREVFVLAAGYSSRQNLLGSALASVNALCPRDVRKTGDKERDTWLRAQMAAEALLEIGLVGVKREELGQVILERLQEWHLAALAAHGVLPLKERARSGVLLAELGDSRSSVHHADAMEFCPVPAGAFLMGSDKKYDSDAQDRELPQHEVELPLFYMARFPVTNAQYAVFIADGGYQAEQCWTEAGWDWQRKNGVDGPERFGGAFVLPNHPVVGVSWYEAIAFCHWLDGRWRERGWLPDGMRVCLPSEAEWEKAARGGRQIPEIAVASGLQTLATAAAKARAKRDNGNPSRIHAWAESVADDGINPDLANYYRSEVGATSPVGTCAHGRSPYGCEEMLGNVWEWTRSRFADYEYEPDDGREKVDSEGVRVVRGGAFDANPSGVRCAYRFRNLPFDRYNYIGFRVALAHSSDL